MTKTSNFAFLFAASGLAALSLTGSRPAAAQTVIISGAAASINPAQLTNGSIDLTAIGTTDWTKWGHDTNPTTFINKAVSSTDSSPVGDISNVTPIEGVVPGGRTSYIRSEQTDGTTVSWTDGSNASYLPSDTTSERLSNADYAREDSVGLGLGWSFTVLVPSMTTGTLYLYEGGYLSTDTLSVTSSDGTADSSMSIDNLNGNGYFTANINNLAATSDTLTFKFYESSAKGNGDNSKIEAAALSLRPNSGLPSAAPEPSQFAGLGFAVLGVLGLLFKAKGRNKSANRSAATASV